MVASSQLMSFPLCQILSVFWMDMRTPCVFNYSRAGIRGQGLGVSGQLAPFSSCDGRGFLGFRGESGAGLGFALGRVGGGLEGEGGPVLERGCGVRGLGWGGVGGDFADHIAIVRVEADAAGISYGDVEGAEDQFGAAE